jgi:hypothetical protein
LLELTVPSRLGDQVAWFDPQRDHMLARFEYRSQDGTGVERIEVVESRQIAGIWVPIKVVRVSSSTRRPEKTQWIYKLDKDKLSLCFELKLGKDAARPKTFETKDNSNVVFVLEKVKE